jgi:hypothetical protein
MIVGMFDMILNETATAIGAIGLAGRADRKIDQRVAERTTAAIAADRGCFDVNDFGWLHADALSNRGMIGCTEKCAARKMAGLPTARWKWVRSD